MSDFRITPIMSTTGFNLNTALANFEEEKTFFGPMFVVISPPSRRRLSRRKSRRERMRELSTMGRVIRRYQAGSSAMQPRRGR